MPYIVKYIEAELPENYRLRVKEAYIKYLRDSDEYNERLKSAKIKEAQETLTLEQFENCATCGLRDTRKRFTGPNPAYYRVELVKDDTIKFLANCSSLEKAKEIIRLHKNRHFVNVVYKED